MKTKLLEKIPAFFISNYFIALIVTVILFFSVDLKFSKYNYEIVDELNKIQTHRNSYFVDLDSDGYFENILIFNNNNTGFASLIIYKQSNNALCQLNFKSRLVNEEFNEFAFADLDNDTIKEIVFCTHREDSLFLNIVYPDSSFYHKQIFVDFIEKCRFGDYSYIFFTRIEDLDNDKNTDILFSVIGFYSIKPRKIYLYNVKKDTLISSNTSGNIIRGEFLLSDINNDGKKEITGLSRAPHNIADQGNVLYGDASSWLMVFNNKLEFLFKPIEEKREFSTLFTGVLNTAKNKYILYYVTKPDQLDEDTVYVISNKGERQESIIIPSETFSKIRGMVQVEDEYVYLYNDYGEICLIDKQFEIKRKIKIEKDINHQYNFYPINIDNDSQKEFFILNGVDKKIIVAEEFFSNFTVIEIPWVNYTGGYSFKVIVKSHLGANILIQDSERAVFIKYYKNKFYLFRFLTLPAIYIITYLILYILTYFQKIQIQRKTERERQLLELQFKTIKNQIEPHFLYNTMTSIGHLIISEDRYQAYDYLERLASLTRKSLEMSDSIAVTLKSELEFIENYIELQKLRFEEKFESVINIDPQVDLNTKIPKMLLQIHIENAIKHGLMHLKTGGVLKLNITRQNNTLQCIIEDNGVGMQQSKKYISNSTGKGLEIAQQTIELYKKIHKTEITQEITDLSETDSTRQGVKVEINISL